LSWKAEHREPPVTVSPCYVLKAQGAEGAQARASGGASIERQFVGAHLF